MSKRDEFLNKAKEAQRYASYAMIPEVRAQYDQMAAHWLELYEQQMRLELSAEAAEAAERGPAPVAVKKAS